MIVPLIIACVSIYAALKGVDVFSAMLDGALDGMKTVVRIFPALVCLLSGIHMLRASGALDALGGLCAPLLSHMGIPPELSSLLFLRPVSGSGALAVGSDIISRYGADSLIGRTAAVILGSTETTFYVIAVYFGAAGVKNGGHALPAALLADLAAFLSAAWAVRLFWG